MTGSQAGGILRRPDDPRRISYLELFFDLAFIFALTQLTLLMSRDLSVGGGLRTALLLAAVWWVWTVTAWSTDWFDPEHPFVRGLVTWVALGGLLMAAAIPEAFDRYPLLFAVTYVTVHLGRGVALMYALRGRPAALRSARVAIWFAATGGAWIVGAVVPSARLALWALAIIVDAAIGLVGYPVPGLRRSSPRELSVNGEHLAERYGQLFLVAIGELILMSGISLRNSGLDAHTVAAFVLAFVNALLFTQIYYLPPAGRRFASVVDKAENSSQLALAAGYLHYVLLAGILAAAAGNDLVISHAGAHREQHRVLVVAGAGLVLASRTALLAVSYRRVPWLRLGGMVVLIAMAPATAHLPPLAVTAGVDLVLFLVTVLDRVSSRGRREAGTVFRRSSSP